MAALTPGLVLVLAVVAAAVPWGLPEPATFVLPLLVAPLVFLLSLRRRGAVHAGTVFGAGVVMDVLTAGPLGYWPLIFLLVHALAQGSAAVPGVAARFVFLWAAFAVATVLACAAGWSVGALYFAAFIDWRPMALGAAAAIAAFPLLAWPMRRSIVSGRRAVPGWRR